MEEPNIHLVGIQRGGGRSCGVEFFVEAFNRTVRAPRSDRGVVLTPAGEIPRSSGCSPPTSRYKDALPLLNKLDVDVMTFECCTNDGMDLEAIGKAITGKKIAIGVVDHRNLQVESPDQVAALIRRR